jgi:hypothetical protein
MSRQKKSKPHTKIDQVKKNRERELVEQFLHICPDFSGYQFKRFEENPDMVYEKNGHELGFDSIIISEDQASVQCHYNPQLCTLSIPSALAQNERNERITVFFENKLFDHLRRYSLPTVLVFSLVEPKKVGLAELAAIAGRFELPEFKMFNIYDYYLCDNTSFVKIKESGPETELG